WDAGLMRTQSHTQALMLLLLYMAGVEAARLGERDAPDGARVVAMAQRDARMVELGNAQLLLLGCAVFAFAVLLVKPELNFVARGVVGLGSEDNNLAIDFIFYSTLPKLVVLLCFAALAIQAMRRRTLWAWGAAGVAFALSAIAANPVNTARQVLLIGLLPLLIHLLARKRRWLLAGLLFGSIAGLGPVLNLISRGSIWGEDLQTFPFSQDFDAMFVVAGILERAPIPELGWGRYLLSAFSFFLPRSLKMFPDFDPLGWTAILGNFSQANLSLPPFTTAYFDFGMAGPALLGFAISLMFRAVDRAVQTGRPVSGSYLAALVLLAAYVPFMRGPILGWGPFAASGLIAAFIAGSLSARSRAAGTRLVRRHLPSA
ncbi:hypothetical protein, partial [uncultured Variovorax sp.]|uniref:hypothetical protein n=1 Tax=uncultured Variovorax sp. TaxID=114708 RepID=UPI0025FA5398